MAGRALVCAVQLPEFDRAAGTHRLWDFISFLRDDGWAVTVIVESTDGDPRVAGELRRDGIAAYIGLNDQSTDAITYGRFDLALLSLWIAGERFVPLLRFLSPSTKIVVDAVDLQFVRSARHHFSTAARESRPFVLDRTYGEEAARELSSYGSADLVLTASGNEASLLKDLSEGGIPAVCVPDCVDITGSPLPFSERRGMVFGGDFRHSPYADGLQWLLREVFPLLPRDVLTDHPLTVVGTAVEKILPLAAGVRGVNVVGWVPEVQPYIHQSRISLLPLPHGARTRRALIQSLMSGAPVVSTSSGLADMGGEAVPGALLADQPDAFARHIITVLEDAATWSSLAEAGAAHVRARHGRETARSRFQAALETLELVSPADPTASKSRRTPLARGASLRAGPERLLRDEPGSVTAYLECAESVDATPPSPAEGSSGVAQHASGAIVVAPFVKLDTLERLCASLLRCDGIKSRKLIFLQDSADGITLAQAQAKEKRYRFQADQVRDFLDSFKALHAHRFLEIEVLANDRNLGPYGTCQAALDHAFKSVDFAIFAEDDVIFAADAMRWFDFGREHLLGRHNISAIAGESWYFESGAETPSLEQIQRLRRLADRHGLVNKYLTMNWVASSCFAVTRNAWQEFGPIRGQVCGDVMLGEHFKNNELRSVYPVVPRVKDVGMLHPDGHSVTVLGAAQVQKAKKNAFLMSDDSYLIARTFEPYTGNEDALMSATSLLDEHAIQRLEGPVSPIEVAAHDR